MQTEREGLNFEGQNIYVGLDVHLKSWTVCIMTETLEHKKYTQCPDTKVLYDYLVGNFPGATYHCVYESGFCGFWLHRQLAALGIKSMVTNAADVPTGQKEKLEKDDVRDSRKLARSLRSGDLVALYIPSEATQEDRSLVRLRVALVKDMTRYKQRIKSHLYFFGIPYPERFSKPGGYWSTNFLCWLKKEVEFPHQSGKRALDNMVEEAEGQRKLLLSVTRQIKEMSQTGRYASDVKLLRTVPGIGLLSAMHWLTEIEEIARFAHPDQLAGYVGLVPLRHHSGELKQDGEMTFRGQPVLKKCIVESAWIAARHDPALSLAYNRYVLRMKPHKAIIRIARKLLNRIYYVLKNKRAYEPGVVQ
jgi:transposase